MASVDVSTKKNLDELKRVGKELLTAPVSRVDLDTGDNKPIPGEGTNGQALEK